MKAINFSTVKETIEYVTLKSDRGFVIFTNNEKIIEISKAGLNNIVLCSTAGEFTTKGYGENLVTGFEYELSDGEVVEILYPPVKSLKSLKESYRKIENNKNAFILLLCDGLSAMEEGIITTLHFVRNDFKIIGGSAGDNLKFQETLIYIGAKKVHSVAIFFNLKNRTQLIKENVYVPTEHRLLVTEVDTINRVIKKFNNKPASEEYARVLGVSESELSNLFMNNPLGKVYENDVYITSPMKVNPDKSITLYSQVAPNTFLYILKSVNPIDEIKSTISKAEFKPNYVLVINCILRSLKFQGEKLWKDINMELLNFCPNTSGFISYGEQFYKIHVNQTAVMLLVE